MMKTETGFILVKKTRPTPFSVEPILLLSQALILSASWNLNLILDSSSIFMVFSNSNNKLFLLEAETFKANEY